MLKASSGVYLIFKTLTTTYEKRLCNLKEYRLCNLKDNCIHISSKLHNTLDNTELHYIIKDCYIQSQQQTLYLRK